MVLGFRVQVQVATGERSRNIATVRKSWACCGPRRELESRSTLRSWVCGLDGYVVLIMNDTPVRCERNPVGISEPAPSESDRGVKS
jgi:hypothetical protein